MNKTTVIAISVLAAVLVAGGSFAGGVVLGTISKKPFAKHGFADTAATPMHQRMHGFLAPGTNLDHEDAAKVREILDLLRDAPPETIQSVLAELQNKQTPTSSGSVQ